MQYCADLAIYVNCHISGIRTIYLKAANKRQAREKATEKAQAIEDSMQRKHREDDIWVNVEDILGER